MTDSKIDVAGQFAARDVEMIHRGDDVLLRSRTPLDDHASTVGAWLQHWAGETPDRTFLAQRSPAVDTAAPWDEPWQELSYAAALDGARRIGQALLDRGLGSERPLVVLSGPSVDHGLLVLACHLAGIPIVPISEAHSLRATSFDRVRYICDLTNAGAVFAASSAMFERVLGELDDLPILTSDGDTGDRLSDLCTTTPTTIDAHTAKLDANSVAKILFTSGSTGNPKGVLTTHGMLCSNQQALAQIWPFLDHEPPIVCDWLPWSHVFGASHNFNMVLRNGGSMYLDDGRPAPGLVNITAHNMASVQPTLMFNVPAGWARLVELLETEPDIAARALVRLRIAFYAGAALSADVWDRLAAVLDRHVPGQVAMVSSWGMTETAPAAVAVHHLLDRPGVIGTPIPGTTVKLIPVGDKTEIRVSGPGVTPGYLSDTERTAEAFDDEGFLRTGDAVRLVDPDDPQAGLVFDGRIAEDFKLATGAWVSAGHIRTDAIAAASPFVSDAVVTGHDREWIGLLVWLAPGFADSEEVRQQLVEKLSRFYADGGGSSTTVRRILIEAEPPSIEDGEITDKGYINQRAVLVRRAAHVDALYEPRPKNSVLQVC